MNPAQGLALAALRVYRLLISPFLPSACRFYPTCSEYASQAIARYGLIQGTLLSAGRLLRCHPFCSGGYDPLR